MNTWSGIVAVAFLVALNGFFVATEFALVKVRPTRLDELARKGSAAAQQARTLVSHLDANLSATQLGITLASLGLGWIGEPAFEHWIAPVTRRLGIADPAAGVVAATVAFLIITFLHIVFGELAPKSVAIQRAEETALAVALPMRAFYAFFYPLIWALNGLARASLRLIGLKPVAEREMAHSEEELRLIVADMRSRSGAARDRLEVLDRTLRLPGRTARELMVPRRDIAFIDLTDPPEEWRARIRATPHGRYPVAEGGVDHIVGILSVRDLLADERPPTNAAELRRLLREPLFVPETMGVDMLLREFRKRRQRMAIVVDEYGGTSGLVTLEDVVEAMLGEMGEEAGAPSPSIAPIGEGRYAIDPRTPVDEFTARFGVDLSDTGATTVGGAVMARLGRVPVRGDRLSLGPVELEIEEMDGPRIARLGARVRRPT